MISTLPFLSEAISRTSVHPIPGRSGFFIFSSSLCLSKLFFTFSAPSFVVARIVLTVLLLNTCLLMSISESPSIIFWLNYFINFFFFYNFFFINFFLIDFTCQDDVDGMISGFLQNISSEIDQILINNFKDGIFTS